MLGGGSFVLYLHLCLHVCEGSCSLIPCSKIPLLHSSTYANINSFLFCVCFALNSCASAAPDSASSQTSQYGRPTAGAKDRRYAGIGRILAAGSVQFLVLNAAVGRREGGREGRSEPEPQNITAVAAAKSEKGKERKHPSRKKRAWSKLTEGGEEHSEKKRGECAGKSSKSDRGVW